MNNSKFKTFYFCTFTFCLFIVIYISFAAFQPGVYTIDSANQLKQALTGNYADWHPPMMAWLWSILIKTTKHFESLLIFHLLLLFFGAWYWGRILKQFGLIYFTLIIPVCLISPIIINFSGVLWKDIGLAFSLLLATGMLGLAIVKNKINLPTIIFILLLLIYSCGVRLNGIFAIILIIMFLIDLILSKAFKQSQQKTIFKSFICIILSIGFCFILKVGLDFFNYDFLKAKKVYPAQYLELFDITGISIISKHNYFPEYIKTSQQFNISRFSEEYKKSILIHGFFNNFFINIPSNGLPPLMTLNTNEKIQNDIKKSWQKAIISEPMAYLKHRFFVFKFLISKGRYTHELPQTDKERIKVNNTLTISEKNKLKSKYIIGEKICKNIAIKSILIPKVRFIYKGWFWLLVLLIELFLSFTFFNKTSLAKIINMTSLSGLIYLLAYFPFAPAPDFRYLYWTTIAGSFSGILIFSYIINNFFISLKK